MHSGERSPSGPELIARASASRADAGEEASGGPAPARRWWDARGWHIGAWVAAVVALYAFFLNISYGGRIDSDGANSALQAWDLIHGHLLLHGWIFGDATFITFELPLNGVTQLIFGLGSQAAHIASALAYLIVAACAVALAVTGARGAARPARAGVAVTVLAAPLLTAFSVLTLVEEPDHPGTSVFILVSALLIDRLADRPWEWRWGAPLLCVILAAGQLGDATILYVAVPAIVAAGLFRVVATRRLRSPDAAVVVAAIISVPLERLVRAVTTHLGGYQMAAPHTAIAPPSRWLGHLPVAWGALRDLYGAHARLDATLSPAAALGMVCLLAAIAGLVRVACTWRRASRAEHILALAMVANLGAFVVSMNPGSDGQREIAAVLPCGAVLAARAMIPAAMWRGWRALAIAVAAGILALAPLTVAASSPRLGPALGPAVGGEGPIPTAPLTAWLEAHGVSYGLSSYWDSSVVTLQSGGRVQIRALAFVPRAGGHGLDLRQPYWEVNSLWYDPALHNARYVIAESSGRYVPATYERFFGPPAATFPVAQHWVILEYRTNLLREILPMLGVGVGPK